MTLPIELVIDKYHPSNTDYMKNVNHLKRLIVAQESQCKPIHTEIAKRHIKNESNQNIADNLSISPSMVHNTLKRTEIIDLIDALQHLSILFEGPTLQLRKRELWEIHVDNKHDDPRVAISAIKEINSMEGVGRQLTDHKVEITVNNNQLPKGALDQDGG